jgi:DNA-binding transcriptional LysR family regulator
VENANCPPERRARCISKHPVISGGEYLSGNELTSKSGLCRRLLPISGEPFIALNPLALLRHRVDSLFADLGLPLSVRAETSSGLSACQMVAKGLGLTLADPLVAGCLAPGQIEVREWDPDLRLTYGFLYSTAHAPSALVLDLAETVARTAKQIQPAAVELLGSQLSGLRRQRGNADITTT